MEAIRQFGIILIVTTLAIGLTALGIALAGVVITIKRLIFG